MIGQLPANMREKIVKTTCPIAGFGPCWTWTGGLQSRGYGCVCHDIRTRTTHKLAYELLVGPVPDGLTLDHLCENKVCCNPRHLEPVTSAENYRRFRHGHFIGPERAA